MGKPQLVLCGGLTRAAAPPVEPPPDETHNLTIGRGRCDVHLRINQVSRAMGRGLTDLDADLLEVAAYFYVADQIITRGGTSSFDYGRLWRRHLRFVIPVRCPAVWNRAEVLAELREALLFLTDDQELEFTFVQAANPVRPEQYVGDVIDDPDNDFEEVVLFSGGLDSLCGAVEEILVGQRSVILVSHRSASRVQARQDALFAAVRGRVPNQDIHPIHVGVTINKGEELNREFTQRGRSFLFAAVAAVVARLAGRRRIRFYENGVTSMNLPLSRELVGARASRTTHPQTLVRFGRLFSQLFGAPFEVQNPFRLTTKAGMLRRLKALNYADLCPQTCSCGHVWGRKGEHPHCGRCSQCVERRITALAGGLTDAEDPPGGYESDVLVGERTGEELTLVERYVGSALDMEHVTNHVEFTRRYSEVNDAIPFIGLPRGEAAQALYDLQRRHAEEVRTALRGVLSERADDLLRRSYPANSLLGGLIGRVEGASSPLPLAANGTTPERGLVVDRDKFEVRFDGRPCFLGNMLEFRVVEYLAKASNRFVPVQELFDEVWDGAKRTSNAVQQVISNLRRCFKNSKFTRLVINGSQPGHYRLEVTPE